MLSIEKSVLISYWAKHTHFYFQVQGNWKINLNYTNACMLWLWAEKKLYATACTFNKKTLSLDAARREELLQNEEKIALKP